MFCTDGALRALLLSSVCTTAMAATPALAASVTVNNGQTLTTQTTISGTDTVTVNTGDPTSGRQPGNAPS